VAVVVEIPLTSCLPPVLDVRSGTGGFEDLGGAIAVDEALCGQRGGDVLGGHGVAVHDVDVL
jgi:hypothetical protein